MIKKILIGSFAFFVVMFVIWAGGLDLTARKPDLAISLVLAVCVGLFVQDLVGK